ncbi:MAG: MFS transporter [Nanoarchaeota archaeon]
MNLIKRFFNINEIEKDVIASSNRKVHEEQKALEVSIKEGSALSFSAGLGTNYISLFALAMKASTMQIGLLSSLTGLMSPISQLYGSKSMDHHSRKKIVLKFAILEAAMWIPIIILGILFWKNIFQNYLSYALIFFYTILTIFSGIAVPAWFSWMGDLIPVKDRGKYLSKRNQITGLVGLLGVIIGAVLLDIFETRGLLLIGFSTIFALTFTFRLISILELKKQFSPKIRIKKEDYFSFKAFLKRFDNYGKFSVYLGLFNFAIMIASPFFIVYMREILEFNYLTLIIISISSSTFYLIFSPIMGRFADKYGNIKLFYTANLFFVFSPLIWIFIKSPILLILIPQLISGLANAALITSTTNFTYDAVRPQKRGICIAYTNLISGMGVFIGSILGGVLINVFSKYYTNPFFIIFGIASLTRLLVGVLFLPHLKEERKFKRLPPVKISLAHPFRAVHAEIGWFRKISK